MSSRTITRKTRAGSAKPTPRKVHRIDRYVSEQTAYVAQLAPTSKIDEAAGIIYDVIVLGPESPNTHGVTGATEGTRYTVTAMEKACAKLDGVHVRVGHPKKDANGDFDPNDKETEDQFGVLHNCKVVERKIIGELHYLKTHPLAASVIESVIRKLNLYSLSQNAFSQGTIVDGWFVVDDIPEIWSVDLVNRGATTGVLVNERLKGKRKMASKKITAVLEGLKAKLTGKHKDALVACLEEDLVPPDATMNDPNADGDGNDNEQDPMDMVSDAIVAACVAVLQGGGTKDEILAKIGDLLDHKDAIEAGSTVAEADSGDEADKKKKAPTEESDDEEKDKKSKTSERLSNIEKLLEKMTRQNENEDTKGKRVAAVCERFKFTPTGDQVAILERLDRKSLPDVVKQLVDAKRGKTRSVGTGTLEREDGDVSELDKMAEANGEDLAKMMGGAL